MASSSLEPPAEIGGPAEPSPWPAVGLLAGLVLLPIVGSWVGGYPVPGHGAALALTLATLGGTWLLWRDGSLPALRWDQPLPWALALVLWPALVGLARGTLDEPALVLLAWRGGALAAALAMWSARRRWPQLRPALGGLGALLLVVGVLGVIATPAGNLGALLQLGNEAPFGNPNFVAHAALPALALGWGAGAGLRWLCGLGILAAAVLGSGLVHYAGDPVQSVWLVGTALLACAAVARCRPRLLGPAVVAGLAALLLAQAWIAVDWHRAATFGPSGVYRVGLYRGALGAWLQAPLWGYGPNQAANLIPAQAAFHPAWLALPSYPENVHHAPLQALLDGGLVQLGLLLGLAATLWRRADPTGRIALAGIAVAALAESHLGQPGPLLLLGLLAGAVIDPRPTTDPATSPARPVATGLLVAIALLPLAAYVRGAVDRGDRALQWSRSLAAAERIEDPAVAADTVAALRRRIGPCDDLPWREAVLRIRAGEHRAAIPLLELQAQRLPLIPGLHRRLDQAAAADAIDPALAAAAAADARQALAACPLPNDLTRALATESTNPDTLRTE